MQTKDREIALLQQQLGRKVSHPCKRVDSHNSVLICVGPESYNIKCCRSSNCYVVDIALQFSPPMDELYNSVADNPELLLLHLIHSTYQ